jgi:hypothetical protein
MLIGARIIAWLNALAAAFLATILAALIKPIELVYHFVLKAL